VIQSNSCERPAMRKVKTKARTSDYRPWQSMRTPARKQEPVRFRWHGLFLYPVFIAASNDNTLFN
jgi:hypothetical protein